MNEEVRTLVRYRHDRAFEAMEEAKILLERRYGNTFVDQILLKQANGIMKQNYLSMK